MALIYQHHAGQRQYELRQSGASLRLYTNGVFHSQWAPHRPLDGSLWDLFALPALGLNARQLKRVLVLGVGGGAALLRLQALFPEAELYGVDLDAQHLLMAREHFGVRATLIHADAQDWLQRCRRKFDWIIEDLFDDSSGAPARAVALDTPWVEQLIDRLRPGGSLLINSLDRKELQRSALWREARLQAHFISAERWQAQGYGNIVSVWRRRQPDPALAERQLQALCQCFPQARRALGRHHSTPIRLRAQRG